MSGDGLTETDTDSIYNEHFGLAERPFTLLPDPDFLYWSDNHTRAYAMLEYGMLTHAPITVITGKIGAGKTTLLRHLLRSLPEDFTVGLISNAQGNRGELLHWVLMALGVPTELSSSYVQLFAQFQDFLIEEYAAGPADHADLRRGAEPLDRDAGRAADVLQHQRRQGRADPAGARRPARAARPHRPAAAGAVRPAGRGRVPPDSDAGRGGAGLYRPPAGGGGRDARDLHPAAGECVHLASRGVPRLVNQICDYALVYAFTDGIDKVDAGVIEKVVTDRRMHGNLKMVVWQWAPGWAFRASAGSR